MDRYCADVSSSHRKHMQKPDLQSLLKDLISVSGISGHEASVRRLIEDAWQPITNQLLSSRLGSLHGLVRGSGPEPRQSLLLAAHMDAIGFMVARITDGFIHLQAVGGIDPRVLPGQLVTVHGREDIPGLIVQPAAHLLPPKTGSGVVPLEHLLVDTGLRAEKVAELVRVGDLVSFAQPPFQMGSDLLAGHSLDNRASVAALTVCLHELRGRSLAWDVWAAATVQEEVTLFGAATSAFELRPSLAVAIDVTFGSGPGSPDHQTYPLGQCVTLGWGPNIHPALFESFKRLADELEIPWKMETLPVHSGTDAIRMQVASGGVPTMVVGIPLRYMHTPVEVVSLKDIQRAGRLLAEFAARLDADYLPKLEASFDPGSDNRA